MVFIALVLSMLLAQLNSVLFNFSFVYIALLEGRKCTATAIVLLNTITSTFII